MTSDELSALRAMLREEVNAAVYASEQRLREEINAAVYASEQRLGERIDKLETTIDELKTTVASMGERLARVEFVQKHHEYGIIPVVP